MTAINQNQFAVTLTLNLASGPHRIAGSWEKKSGGLADSNTTTFMPGAMGPQTAIAGTQTVSEMTLERVYDLERDEGGGVVDALLYNRGKARCTVKQVSLDENGAAYETGFVATGILKSCQIPDYDATAVTSPAMLTCTITLDGNIARSA